MSEIRNIKVTSAAQLHLNFFLLEDFQPAVLSALPNIYEHQLENHFALFKLQYFGTLPFPSEAKKRTLRATMLVVAKNVVGETRERLTYAFNKLGFVDEEIKNLQNKRWWIRAHSCRNLSLMQSKKAVAHIVQLLDDENDNVKTEAVQTLIDIVGVDALSAVLLNLKKTTLWIKIHLARSISAMGSSAAPHLIKGLQSDVAEIKIFCLEMLGTLADISAVSTIKEYIGYNFIEVQAASLIALGKIGDHEAVPIIVQFLQSKNKTVRTAAIQSAGFLASPQTIALLYNILLEQSLDEKILAAEALSKMGEFGIMALHNARAVENSETKTAALQYLHERGIVVEKA